MMQKVNEMQKIPVELDMMKRWMVDGLITVWFEVVKKERFGFIKIMKFLAILFFLRL